MVEDMPANHEIHYFSLNTPYGPCAFAFRKAPFKVCKVFLPGKTESIATKGSGRDSNNRPPDSDEALEVAGRIDRYFKGIPLEVPLKWLEWGPLTELQRAVLTATADIPYGRTASYRDIAGKVARPRAYRFVGTTMALNPFPLIIPCHRVIKSDGRLGRFGGGSALKRQLIQLEKTTTQRIRPVHARVSMNS